MLWQVWVFHYPVFFRFTKYACFVCQCGMFDNILKDILCLSFIPLYSKRNKSNVHIGKLVESHPRLQWRKSQGRLQACHRSQQGGRREERSAPGKIHLDLGENCIVWSQSKTYLSSLGKFNSIIHLRFHPCVFWDRPEGEGIVFWLKAGRLCFSDEGVLLVLAGLQASCQLSYVLGLQWSNLLIQGLKISENRNQQSNYKCWFDLLTGFSLI